MPITSDGKAPNLLPFLDEICEAVGKAVKTAHRPNARGSSQKDVVLDNLGDVIAEVSGDGENRPKAEVGVVEPMGNEQIVYVTLSGGDRLVAVAPPQELIRPGDIVSIRVRPEGVHIFEVQSGKRIEPSPQPIHR